MTNFIYKDTAIPTLGFGTWQLKDDECVKCVREALAIGYRHIDTAQAYENEEQVGQGIQDSRVQREDIFLTTKIWIENAHAQDVKSSLDGSLKRLNTDYVDLLLMHWPVEDVPFEETMRAFEDVQKAGKTKLIGVSNFTVSQMKQVKEELGIDIACNQVEYHPTLSQDPVLNFIRQHDMLMTAYSPLGRGEDLEEPTLKELAEKHDKSVGQVVLRWLIQQENVCAIPKSSNMGRIKENFEIFDFELDDKDMQKIFDLAREDSRLISPDWAPEWDNAKKAA
jgi:2,5-diketo-D-gluconate reductase B